MEDKKTHWLKLDPRREVLQLLILQIDNLLALLRDKAKTTPYYDGLFLLQESEPLFGLGFIAFQNYINANIADLKLDIKNKHQYYKLFSSLPNYESTGIELIIALANYSKHKEEGEELRQGTKKILQSFNLKCDLEVNIAESPVLKGIEILSPPWNLGDVFNYIVQWRDLLWDSREAK